MYFYHLPRFRLFKARQSGCTVSEAIISRSRKNRKKKKIGKKRKKSISRFSGGKTLWETIQYFRDDAKNSCVAKNSFKVGKDAKSRKTRERGRKTAKSYQK